MNWFRKTILVTNLEVIVLLAVVIVLMVTAWCAITDNALLRERHESLIDSINLRCTQAPDGSGTCGVGTWSGVGVAK